MVPLISDPVVKEIISAAEKTIIIIIRISKGTQVGKNTKKNCEMHAKIFSNAQVETGTQKSAKEHKQS